MFNLKSLYNMQIHF